MTESAAETIWDYTFAGAGWPAKFVAENESGEKEFRECFEAWVWESQPPEGSKHCGTLARTAMFPMNIRTRRLESGILKNAHLFLNRQFEGKRLFLEVEPMRFREFLWPSGEFVPQPPASYGASRSVDVGRLVPLAAR